MATYAQLQKQIEQLQKQAEKAREAEKAQLIARLRESIEASGITAEELFGAPAKPRKVAAAKKAPRERARSSVGVPKYRDPKSGKTWTGIGKPPAWIATAKDRSRFLIEQPAAVEEAAPQQLQRAARRKADGRKTAAGAKRTKRASAAGRETANRKGTETPAKRPRRQAKAADAGASQIGAPADVEVTAPDAVTA